MSIGTPKRYKTTNTKKYTVSATFHRDRIPTREVRRTSIMVVRRELLRYLPNIAPYFFFIHWMCVYSVKLYIFQRGYDGGHLSQTK